MIRQERTDRSVNTIRRRRSLAAALIVGATVSGLLSFGSAGALTPTAIADQPLSDSIFMPANRVARFLGIGYSDGYHASAGRSNCALLDLPPASAYANQTHHGYMGQAMLTMPAQAYNFSGPTWVNGGPQSMQHYESVHTPTNTYPVQPSSPPQPIYPNNPNPNPGIAPPQTPAPAPTPATNDAPNSGKRQAPSNRKPEPETIPAPKPQPPSSPSDLLPDPPTSKFFDEDPTQTLLEGLEDLGEEKLQDPLNDDAPMEDPSANLLNDDSDMEIPLLPETPTGTDLDSDLDLDMDLDSLELPGPTGGDDDLLTDRYRFNPHHHQSSNQYTPAAAPRNLQPHATVAPTPRQAINQRLTAPANNQHTTVYEPQSVAPAVSRSIQAPTAKQPRTAARIYEPRR